MKTGVQPTVMRGSASRRACGRRKGGETKRPSAGRDRAWRLASSYEAALGWSTVWGMTRSPDLTRHYAHLIKTQKYPSLRRACLAAGTVNRALIVQYRDIGKDIVEKRQALSRGQAVIEQIARDLRASFPGTQRFSARNVWGMRRLDEQYPGSPVLRQLVAEGPRRSSASDCGGRGRRPDGGASATACRTSRSRANGCGFKTTRG